MSHHDNHEGFQDDHIQIGTEKTHEGGKLSII